MSMNPCPECGQNDFVMRERPVALLNWNKVDNEPVLNVHDWIPVRAWVCQSCSFVKLFYQNPDLVISD